MLPICHFYCVGYSARNVYRGLDNFHIANLWALISQCQTLLPNDRAFVEHYGTHYILDEGDRLSALTSKWFVDTTHLCQLASTLPDAPHQLVKLAYYVIGAVEMRGSDAVVLGETQFILTQAKQLGFREEEQSVTFLGYDIVEPSSFWSVVMHANEWGSQPFRGNQHGLCSTLDDAQMLLQQYSRSDDIFQLPTDENLIVALYQLSNL